MSNPLPVFQGQREEADQRNKRGVPTRPRPSRSSQQEAGGAVHTKCRTRRERSARRQPRRGNRFARLGRRAIRRARKPLAALRSSGPGRSRPTPAEAAVRADRSRADSSANASCKARRAVDSAAERRAANGRCIKSRRARRSRAGGLHAKCSRRRRLANLGVVGREERRGRASALTKRQGVRYVAPSERARPEGRARPRDAGQLQELPSPSGPSQEGKQLCSQR